MALREDDRRKQLFAAAQPLFGRFGYRKTTIEEICREAGMSKRTFYEEFRDKGDFFGHVILDEAKQFLEEWSRDVESMPTARERIEALVDRYIVVCKGPSLYRLVFECDESREAVEKVFTTENVEPMNQAMIPTMEMGMETGELRQHDPDTVSLILGMMLDSIFVILPQLFRNCTLDYDDTFIAEMKAFIVHGLLAR